MFMINAYKRHALEIVNDIVYGFWFLSFSVWAHSDAIKQFYGGQIHDDVDLKCYMIFLSRQISRGR